MPTLVALFVCVAAIAAVPPDFEVPRWAFPLSTPPFTAARAPFDSVRRLTLPGSSQSFTMAQIRNTYGVPDWFPESHPAMPDPVGRGRGRKSQACAYCHLADGQGRSENATLAGLPADYIVHQVRAFRDRTRQEAVKDWPFAVTMARVADSVSDADLDVAAKYFASIRPRPRYKVLERDTIQRSFEIGGLRALDPAGGVEALGNRIVEITESLEGHEMRDPRTGFISYVPVGSIERGRRIATAGGAGAPNACVTCHGTSLLGMAQAPLIAGRSPAYVLRQLIAFRTGARNDEASGPMRTVAARLSLDDMIAVAAYVGSRPVK